LNQIVRRDRARRSAYQREGGTYPPGVNPRQYDYHRRSSPIPRNPFTSAQDRARSDRRQVIESRRQQNPSGPMLTIEYPVDEAGFIGPAAPMDIELIDL